jgi:hypothetical protein
LIASSRSFLISCPNGRAWSCFSVSPWCARSPSA